MTEPSTHVASSSGASRLSQTGQDGVDPDKDFEGAEATGGWERHTKSDPSDIAAGTPIAEPNWADWAGWYEAEMR